VSKFIDLTGKTFGKIEVLSMDDERGQHGQIQWNCRCICGNQYVLSGGDLTRSRRTTQCKKCRQKEHAIGLVGQTFEKLTVLSMADVRSKDGSIQWNCKCSCGNFCVKTTVYLRHAPHRWCDSCKTASRIENLTGRVFGKLTVDSMFAERVSKKRQAKWNCVCSCGGSCVVTGDSLRTGRRVDCGCTRGVDLTGRVFGELTVISSDKKKSNRQETRWNCKCSCGNTRVVRKQFLIDGTYTACVGCQKKSGIIDLTGRVFGELTVLSMLEERGRRGAIQWSCRCSCGNTHSVLSGDLTGGRIQSCGCSRKRKSRHDAIVKNQYNQLKHRHCSKGFLIQELISFELFKKLSYTPCYYCGAASSKKLKDNFGSTHKIYLSDTVIHVNGIDRVDSSKGYVNGNVVSCCGVCNSMKRETPLEEFKAHVDKIQKHLSIKSETLNKLKPTKRHCIRNKHKVYQTPYSTQRTVYQGPGT